MTAPVKDITYRAFLSYSHRDTSEAAWLHKKLEEWRIDRDLVGRETTIGPVPETLRPIFRDREDFAGGHSLEQATHAALEASEFLIVLCSPSAVASDYVNEEVRKFKAMGRADRVIPVIIAGEPYSDTFECFPPAVKYTVDDWGQITDTPAEPLAPDFRDRGDGRRRAAAKVVAGLLGVRYDEIRQRARQARSRARLQTTIAAASFLMVTFMGGFYYWKTIHLATQQELSQKQLAKLEGLVKDLLSSSAETAGSPEPETAEDLEKALKFAQRRANAGDRRMARALIQLSWGRVVEAQKLFQEVADDKAARIEKARTYIKRQETETAAAFRNLGAIARLADPRRARMAYARALEFDPDHPDTLYWHGTLHLRAGDLGTAEKSLTRLMDVATLKRNRLGIYRAHLRLGEIVKDRGNLEAALVHQRQAIAIARGRLTEQPKNLDRQHELSVSYEKVGDVQMAQGNLAGALRNYNKALAIAERLIATDPDNAGWQRGLSISHERVGNIQITQGDLESALKSHRGALAIRERLAKADPKNAGWQRGLSVSFERVGNVEMRQGNLEGALTLYHEGLAITERLAASDPNNAGWQRDLSVSHGRVGSALAAQGDLKSALKSYRDSLAIAERLASSDIENAGWQRDLSVSYEKVGDVQLTQNDLGGALSTYRRSLAIRQHLAGSDPKNAGWQRDLAVSYNKLGDVQVAHGAHDAAQSAFGHAHAIMERLTASDPMNAGWQHHLSMSLEKIGTVRLAQGAFDQALAAYSGGLSITRKLASSDPRNASWQRDLSVAFSNVGRVQVELGEHEAALTAYRHGLLIMEKLATADPGNPGLQVDLVVGQGKLGLLFVKMNRREEALATFREGRAMIAPLARNAEHGRWQDFLGLFDREIASLGG